MALVKDGKEQHYMWTLMCAIYVSLLAWTLYQMGRILYFKHRLKSFQGLFLLLCLMWTLLRVIFWLTDTELWVDWFALFVYWAPTLVQFAMFSLLVFFYVKLIHLKDWKNVKFKFYCSYCVLNFAFTGTTVYWIIVEQHEYNYEEVRFFFSLFSGILFGCLTFVLGWYGYKVYKLQLSHRMRMLHPFASATAMVGLTLLSFLVFFTRSLYGFLQAIGGWGIVPIPVGQSRAQPVSGSTALVIGWKVIDYPTFVLNIAWEIVPTIALLYFFRSIPRSRDTLYKNLCRFICGARDYNAIPTALSTPSEHVSSDVENGNEENKNGDYRPPRSRGASTTSPSDKQTTLSSNAELSNEKSRDEPYSRNATGSTVNSATSTTQQKTSMPRTINARVTGRVANTVTRKGSTVESTGDDEDLISRMSGQFHDTATPSSASPRVTRRSRESNSPMRNHSNNSNGNNSSLPGWWAGNRGRDTSDSESGSSPFIGSESAEKYAFTPGIGWNLPPPVRGRNGSMEPRDFLLRASSPSAKPTIFPRSKSGRSKSHGRKQSRHGSSVSDDSSYRSRTPR